MSCRWLNFAWLNYPGLKGASKAASAKEKGEISRLSDKIEALNLKRKDTLLEMEQLKNDMGRVQGQQPTHHRVVADPDAYDGEMGVDVADYEFIFGMIPTDIPPSGSVEHHAPPDSGDTAPSTMSHNISIHDYETGE
ncbi:hypothetical protein Pyn_38923 [Prunus yedoensis var. nudiflora]|uniref:Uncharacterized protein n=1 Tax=Prunus yedoensis var. nudiflora TaxID=2094558 RepID=A0A314UG48_PRUYE|nr:hypothetical protein Pyn_38923 [Prunus yedoensis var. nudiflora]